MMNVQKYKKAYHPVPKFNRTWPDNEITKAPIWCSVDLRDGNQALFSPMTLEEKLEFFQYLVKIGIKEIEVGFPAASDTEYQFVRALIDRDLIPDDVTIQVLTQAREHIIEKTVEALSGAKNVIIHLYNSTSTLQRRVVFRKDQADIKQLAIDGATYLTSIIDRLEGTNVSFEYSPESFTCTEFDYAAEVCNAVIEIFRPYTKNKVIINLPSTIEVSSPNVFADQIEYMHQNLAHREDVLISVHAHNDRGCAVAASEMALLAGADRVEGTLFGNGERTGNADIVMIGLNMYVNGVDPELNLENIDELIQVYEKYNKLTLSPRHPYAGELAYVAFSGSHQDAIKKSMDAMDAAGNVLWENPYLTIDPTDIGRVYEPIKINSQSGRGGVHYVMENKFGYTIPKPMLIEFASIIKHVSDQKATVLPPDEIFAQFEEHYLYTKNNTPFELEAYHTTISDDETEIELSVRHNGTVHALRAKGNGPLDAACNAIRAEFGLSFEIASYNEHALTKSSTSKAVTYLSVSGKDDTVYWGAGVSGNINTASIRALLCAVNKMK